MADQKNLFLAVALSIVILITWNVMVEQPKMEKERIALEQQQATAVAQHHHVKAWLLTQLLGHSHQCGHHGVHRRCLQQRYGLWQWRRNH